MIFDESVQLPAFPRKITRNAMERSYVKRIINVKMNEFSPMNRLQGGKNMFSQNNDSFLLTNSFSGGFPIVQSRGNTSHIHTNIGEHQGGIPLIPAELSQIVPPSPARNEGEIMSTILDDSLYKPSVRDITIHQDTTQPSVTLGTTPSIHGVSLHKASMM
jgi:hypothetical protein